MMTTDEFLDIPQEYKELIAQLASIRRKDNKWINDKFILHRKFMIDDAHHGYCIEDAIENIKEDIKTWTEVAYLKQL